MREILCDASPRGFERRGGWGLTILATVLLSFGIGAATAAFTVMSAASRHSAPFVSCATMHDDVEGDAVSAWSDVTDDVDARSVAPLFAASLAMLVACARGAARMLAAPDALEVVGVSALGALFVSSMLSSVLGLPAMGFRGVAFAFCVSLLAGRFARTARNNLLPIAA
jgi:hypothetical protein